jgi:urea transporter
MGELLARFMIGGVIVTFFAVLAEMLRPKSFAGLFGAAPSIALATLGITIAHHGKAYAAIESRSMICGAIAFLLYAACVSWVLIRLKSRALAATVVLMPVWFAVSFAFWLVVR